MRMRRGSAPPALLIANLLTVCLVTSCGSLPTTQATAPSPLTPTLPLEDVAAEDSTPAPISPPGEAEILAGPDVVELSVWMVDDPSPQADVPGSETLIEQLADFDEMNPDIRVEVQSKRVTGRGSTLDYLRTAPPVAPSILPDVVLLSRSALVTAAREDLIIAWDSTQEDALLALDEAVYPAAANLGRVDDALFGLPYMLEIRHSVYSPAAFGDTVPLSFEELLDSGVGEEVPAYSFPAARTGGVNRTTLLQYLATGGSLRDDEGQPFIDSTAFTSVLAFYVEAQVAGMLDPSVLQYATPDETWAQYTQGAVDLAEVSTVSYLRGRADGRDSALASIPTAEGESITLVTGWLWALTTDNPDQQAAVAELLMWLMEPVNHGTYAHAVGYLPSQPDALAVWGSDPYVALANDLMAVAAIPPDPAIDSAVGATMQEAVEDVLLGRATPSEAASEAASAIGAE